MANPKQLHQLKTSIVGWNNWRADKPDENIDLIKVDLNEADLSQADLSRANFSQADFSGANLREANLNRANFCGANLILAKLIDADITSADLSQANLIEANLFGADLSGANLREADLSRANLRRANLEVANLFEVNLSGADLGGANFKETRIGNTIFGNTNLSETDNLETVRHIAPSTIGADTIQLSEGKIPVNFLRGCGLSDILIETAKLFNPDLTNEEIIKIQYRIYDLRATQAIQISPLFISYSNADSIFVNCLDSSLTEKGVRFWRDIHDTKAGRLETQIDRAIRQHPTVLLILSKNSLNSDWVQHEVRKARELEKELGRDVLCPIALDDNWKSSNWPARIMEQVTEYNILDFSGWEDNSTFESIFAKLLNGLDLFFKKPST